MTETHDPRESPSAEEREDELGSTGGESESSDELTSRNVDEEADHDEAGDQG